MNLRHNAAFAHVEGAAFGVCLVESAPVLAGMTPRLLNVVVDDSTSAAEAALRSALCREGQARHDRVGDRAVRRRARMESVAGDSSGAGGSVVSIRKARARTLDWGDRCFAEGQDSPA